MVYIFRIFRKKESNLSNLPKVSEIGKKVHNLQANFKGILEEFDDHLHSINENTSEIQANYEYIRDLDRKIDKLNERLDEISMSLGIHKPAHESFNPKPLTRHEKEVFLVLYTSEDKDFITYKEIAKKLLIPESLVVSYITNLVEKGIPILKRYFDGNVVLKLHPSFKNMQIKMNLLNISARDSQQVLPNF